MQTLTQFPRWKRALDLICVLVSLPFWLTIMVCISAWIKLVSRGPILFKQQRMGLGGRPFMILKFRSMYRGAPTLVHENHVRDLIRSNRTLEKLDCSDQRVIPFGRFIRALGFDELPQLINVLRGEMSLVGPRPSTISEFEVFGDRERGRVQVPPGLTGVWQVSGKNRLKFSEMIDLDLEYAKSMGLKQDLRIMLRTIPALWVQWRELQEKRRVARAEAKERAEHEAATAPSFPETDSSDHAPRDSKRIIVRAFGKPGCMPSLGSGIRKL
jgi:lipopolysaccharide/colanic/teichoic acid biosynthesis glycosyltransferase